jgi:hypothetical protein
MHIKEHAEISAQHHREVSKCHGALAKAHRTMAEKCDDEEMKKAHETAAGEHESLRELHEKHAAHFDALHASTKKTQEADLNKLAPTQIHAVVPDNPMLKMIPRAGAPPAKVEGVPLEFEKLFAVADEA